MNPHPDFKTYAAIQLRHISTLKSPNNHFKSTIYKLDEIERKVKDLHNIIKPLLELTSLLGKEAKK